MQTQRVSNGHGRVGRPAGFTVSAEGRRNMAKAQRARQERLRAAQQEAASGPRTAMTFTPKDHILDRLTTSITTHTPSMMVQEIDTLIATRQAELDALRVVRGLLLTATDHK